MKRTAAFIAVLLTMLSVSSCGTAEKNESLTVTETSGIEIAESAEAEETAETASVTSVAVQETEREPPRGTGETREELDIDIHMLNIFLSNFSELYCRDYSIDNKSEDKMIDFVILNTYFNYGENFSAGPTVEYNSMQYSRRVSGEYIKNRIKRYFDVSIENKSTDSFYYDGTDYYYPNADGEFHIGFSKVTSVYKSGTGNLIAEYNVYEADKPVDDNVLDNQDSIYYGYGDENCENCKLVGTGRAVLNEKYFGEGYANFTLVSLEHTVTE